MRWEAPSVWSIASTGMLRQSQEQAEQFRLKFSFHGGRLVGACAMGSPLNQALSGNLQFYKQGEAPRKYPFAVEETTLHTSFSLTDFRGIPMISLFSFTWSYVSWFMKLCSSPSA